MNSLFKLIGKRKTIIFLDLEGTQFSHEMIALGAYRCDLDSSYKIKKVHPGIHFYCKSKNKIGHYVEKLTGINQDILEKKGLTFKKAMQRLKKYSGHFLSRIVFCTFGNHDLRIIMKSLENSPDADETFCRYIVKNCIDLSAVTSRYIEDEKGNPLSLINSLKVFNVELKGDPHNPLTDALHLMYLYKAFISKPEIVFEQYKKVLIRNKALPEPIKYAVNKLVEGQDVSSEEFLTQVKEYLK